MCSAMAMSSSAGSGSFFEVDIEDQDFEFSRSELGQVLPKAQYKEHFQDLLNQCIGELTGDSYNKKQEKMTATNEDKLETSPPELHKEGVTDVAVVDDSSENSFDGWVIVTAGVDSALEVADHDCKAKNETEPHTKMLPEEIKSRPKDVLKISDDTEWPALSNEIKANVCKAPSPSPSSSKVSKRNLKKRKCRKFPPADLGFRYRYPVQTGMVYHWEEEIAISIELSAFEDSLVNNEWSLLNLESLENSFPCEMSEQGHENEKETTQGSLSETATPTGMVRETNNTKKKKLKQKQKSITTEEEVNDIIEPYNLNDGVAKFFQRNITFGIEETLGRGMKLRRKKKWRKLKGHKAAKTKHLRLGNVKNSPHGRTIYVSSRIYNNPNILSFSQDRCGNYYRSLRTTARGFPTLQELREARKANRINCVIIDNRPPPRKVPKPNVQRAIITAYNADADLAADLVNDLMAIQDRELTPEDYELLLRLDERVKPKTIEEEIVDALKTDFVTEESLKCGEVMCPICLDPYLIGQKQKFLPCSHVFHCGCIDNWLKFSSQNCPLDGLPLTQE